MKEALELFDSFKGKKVLFITTKNLDYIRNSQELELLEDSAGELEVIGSNSHSYPKRLLHVYSKLITTKVADFDIAFVGFAPQLVLPFFKGKFKKVRVITDFFISVYDTICFDRKILLPDTILGKLTKKLDVKTIRLSDEIICDTKAHGQYFISEFEADENHVHRLFLKADTSIYHPDVKKPNVTDTAHRVLYFGSILPLQGVEVILKALEEFMLDEQFMFDIIGPTGDEMNRPKGKNIHYISWLTQEALAEKIAQADLCLAGHFSDDIMKAKRTIPGKAYIYEAMEKPFILGDSPANHELFEPDEKHIFVKMGDAKALASAIRNYFNDQDSTL